MDRDDAPCSLYEELHEEARGGQRAFCRGEDPGWDHQAGDEGRDDDGASATNPLREIANDGSSDTRPRLHEDRGTRGLGVVKLLLCQHECGI